MESKRCFCCRATKPLSEFYKHSMMADGHLNKCKECVKSYIRKHYKENREKIRAYEKKRGSRPERREAKRRYEKASRHKNPDKAFARAAVSNAIQRGNLKREPCEVCGDPKSQGHHDDYSKPLQVRWLCFKHHREHHGQKVGP